MTNDEKLDRILQIIIDNNIMLNEMHDFFKNYIKNTGKRNKNDFMMNLAANLLGNKM